ncbi:MAG: prephenate dehydrogenase/arogenate dehydrogenase family protein [Ilumatobacteraceae bacterium]|nr:prephenate dehydrogenase/arogenate dehydrogenase family protein [Ilumatobacteraceae bacterium]
MSNTAATTNRRATVVGLGLIGGSLCVALRERGWLVSGDDQDPQRVTEALERGLISAVGIDAESQVTFVAVPVTAISLQVQRALDATNGIVTDVGSVKAVVTRTITDPRFIGGHPMAGSELEGLDGADGELFTGAVWVLTPTPTTSDAAFATVANIVNDLGAEVVGLDPVRHDELVAIVSHVPHLTAATLMGVAGSRATEHAALLRLAAGGFRDMTRIASGHPAIWLDICAENRPAIISTLSALIDGLSDMRTAVDTGDRATILQRLTAARESRANLPSRIKALADLSEVRIPIPDRPGAAAEVFTLAAELGVNIPNFEVVHSVEGDRGIAVVLVETTSVELFRGGLMARGFKPSVQRLD